MSNIVHLHRDVEVLAVCVHVNILLTAASGLIPVVHRQPVVCTARKVIRQVRKHPAGLPVLGRLTA